MDEQVAGCEHIWNVLTRGKHGHPAFEAETAHQPSEPGRVTDPEHQEMNVVAVGDDLRERLREGIEVLDPEVL